MAIKQQARSSFLVGWTIGRLGRPTEIAGEEPFNSLTMLGRLGIPDDNFSHFDGSAKVNMESHSTVIEYLLLVAAIIHSSLSPL